MALGFGGQAILLRSGHVLDALLLDLGGLEHGGDQLLFIAQNLRLLHLDLALALHLLHLHLLGGHLLQHDVGLQLVGLVGRGLLLLLGEVRGFGLLLVRLFVNGLR